MAKAKQVTDETEATEATESTDETVRITPAQIKNAFLAVMAEILDAGTEKAQTLLSADTLEYASELYTAVGLRARGMNPEDRLYLVESEIQSIYEAAQNDISVLNTEADRIDALVLKRYNLKRRIKAQSAQ